MSRKGIKVVPMGKCINESRFTLLNYYVQEKSHSLQAERYRLPGIHLKAD